MHPKLVLLVVAHALAVLGLVAWSARFVRGARATNVRPWAKGIVAAVLGVGIGLSAYAWIIEPLRTTRTEITIESEAFHGAPLRVVALGDIHLGGPHVSASRLQSIVADVTALDADLVVLLGDYIDGHDPRARRSPAEREALERGLVALSGLKAKLGVVAVLGNHDLWYDRGAVTDALTRASIPVLWNQHLVVHRPNGEDLAIVGLADATTGEPDYRAALADIPEGVDKIVLMHSPDPFADSPPGVALTLAAHTHCGQVLVPFIGRPQIPSHFGQRFACGLVRERGEPLFVTAGLGTSILPVRFLTPPEIVVATLVPSK